MAKEKELSYEDSVLKEVKKYKEKNMRLREEDLETLNDVIDNSNISFNMGYTTKGKVQEFTYRTLNKYNPFFEQPPDYTSELGISDISDSPVLTVPCIYKSFSVEKIIDMSVHESLKNNPNYIPFDAYSEYDEKYSNLKKIFKIIPYEVFLEMLTCYKCKYNSMPYYKSLSDEEVSIFDKIYEDCINNTVKKSYNGYDYKFFEFVLGLFLTCNEYQISRKLLTNYRFLIEKEKEQIDEYSFYRLRCEIGKKLNYYRNGNNVSRLLRDTVYNSFPKPSDGAKFYNSLVQYSKLNREQKKFPYIFLRIYEDNLDSFDLQNMETLGFYFKSSNKIYSIGRPMKYWDYSYVYNNELVMSEYISALSPKSTHFWVSTGTKYTQLLQTLSERLSKSPYYDRLVRVRNQSKLSEDLRSHWIVNEEIKMTLSDIKNLQKYGSDYFKNVYTKFGYSVQRGLLENTPMFTNILYYSLYHLKDLKTCECVYVDSTGAKLKCRIELFVHKTMKDIEDNKDSFKLKFVLSNGTFIVVDRSTLYDYYISGRLLF